MEQSLTLQQQQPQQQLQQQQQQQQPTATLQILDLSNVEYDLTGIGVGDPMAYPDQAALIPQPLSSQQQLPQPQQPQQQPLHPPNQQQEAVDVDNLDEILEILAAQGVDDPSALPFPL